MARRSYTPEQKAEAIKLYATAGPTVVERTLGIEKGTVSRWAKRAGVETTATASKTEAVKALRVSVDQRRLALADGLLDDAQRLRSQLFAPCVERVVKTIGTGKGYSASEIVKVDHDEPSFGDKQRILTAIAIAVDKVQLLTGEATERVETVSREAVESEIGELLHLVPKAS